MVYASHIFCLVFEFPCGRKLCAQSCNETKYELYCIDRIKKKIQPHMPVNVSRHGMQRDMRSSLDLIALTLTPCATSMCSVDSGCMSMWPHIMHVVEYYKVYILISIMNEKFYSKFKS